jgi:amidase
VDAADLVFSGIARQAQLVRAGEVSSRELVQACLARIEALDPQLNAWRVVLGERALADADDADVRRREDDPPPLLGVPIAVKDDVDVAGTTTAWGSAAHAGERRRDAACVARLREAGAIVLGKTSVPELTLFPFTESRTFGVTRNPWDLGRTPGGSSGGTAAAVAAGMVGAGLGSDGGGSIRVPAAWCGLIGIKPSAGRVSLEPRPDAGRGLAVLGPIARSVGDAALLLDALAERRPERPFADAERGPARRLRIAVAARRPPGAPPLPRLDRQWRAALASTAELLASLGHDVVEARPRYGLGPLRQFMGRYLRGVADEVDRLESPERLERRTVAMARLGRRWSPRRVERLRARADALRERVWSSIGGADVLMTPTCARSAPEVGRWEGRGALATLAGVAGFIPYSPLANITGQPAVSVPAGWSREGWPLAVQLVGAPDDDHALIALAAELEAARPWAHRRPPVS